MLTQAVKNTPEKQHESVMTQNPAHAVRPIDPEDMNY